MKCKSFYFFYRYRKYLNKKLINYYYFIKLFMRRWQSMWCIATPGGVLQWSFDYSQRRVTWSRSSHACLHKFLTVTTTCFQTRKTLHFRQKYIHDTIFEHNGFLLTGIAFLHTVKYPWQLYHNSLSQMMASW
jgi:hypothetical protein